PTTNRSPARALTADAFSRASSAATSPGWARPARVSMPRSSISAGSIVTGRPADSSTARRAVLFEASTIGSDEDHNDMLLARRLAPTLRQQRDDGRRGFLDRSARHVDHRPVVPGAQAAREGDLLG